MRYIWIQLSQIGVVEDYDDSKFWIVSRNTIVSLHVQRNNQDRGQMLQAYETVITAWAATTVGGIKSTEACYRRSLVWKTWALRDWLMDVARYCMPTAFAVCIYH